MQARMMIKMAGMAATVLMGFSLTLPAKAAIVTKTFSYSGNFFPTNIANFPNPIGPESIGSIQGFFAYDDISFTDGIIDQSEVTDWEFSWFGGATAAVGNFSITSGNGFLANLAFGDLSSVGGSGNDLIFQALDTGFQKTLVYDSTGLLFNGIIAGVAIINDDNGSDVLYDLSYPSSTPVPTPALLPGLIGIGVAAIRKRKLAQSDAA